MKQKIFFLFVFIFLLNISSNAQTDTVLNRYKQQLFKTAHATDVNLLMKSLNTDGYWSDIDYHNESRSDWQLMRHLQRLQELAVAWSDPSSNYFHKDKLKQGIDRALDYWLYHRFYNPNWWYNEIGVPQYMGNIIILLRPYLSKYQHIRAFEELDQYRINGTGTNLIWSAELGFYYGALTKDTALMRHCIDTISHEIRINAGEGIQPDYSFHMHGNRLQIYSYGKAYLSQVLDLILLCKGTEWAMPENKVNLLTDFVLKGWQWMARGINTVPGTMDRGVSHQNALHAADIRNLIPDLIKLAPDKSSALQALLNRQNGDEIPLTGFRYYPYSDFATYQCKDFSFFLKTISTRTLPSESINGENLKGHLLNSGNTYLIHDGSEYYNLMPVWNWDKIPGITAFKDADRIVRKSFTGSVSDGKSGLTAMDYVMKGKDTTQKVKAHKIWICHNNMIICLIAGLTAENVPGNVYTIMDQCRLNDEIYINNTTDTIRKISNLFRKVHWIYQHGFAYIPLQPSTVKLYAKTVQGSWHSINLAASGKLVTDSIFMPILIHGQEPVNSSSGYILTYFSKPSDVKKFTKDPTWNVLRNDSACQAVQFADKTLLASFFIAGGLRVNKTTSIQVSMPCLLLLSNHTLYVSDPLHHGAEITITTNRKTIQMDLPSDGITSSLKF